MNAAKLATRSVDTHPAAAVEAGTTCLRVRGPGPTGPDRSQNDRVAMRSRPGSVRPEAEHLRGVFRGDLAQIGLGHTGEHALQELLRARESGLRVRVVAAPQHVLDADPVAQLDAEIILH